MDYMTLKEASEKWGVTPRRINYYCAAGRIPGAIKMATIWLIPKDAEKPIDRRTKQGKTPKPVSYTHLMSAYVIPQPLSEIIILSVPSSDCSKEIVALLAPAS